MTMTPAQIDLWRQAVSEHQRLGFKEAKNGLDRTKLNEYCVAIANEGGGHLILGISDKPSIPLFLTVVRSSCARAPDLSRRTRNSIDGSPKRALKVSPPFDHFSIL
jgi:hypothetical protein